MTAIQTENEADPGKFRKASVVGDMGLRMGDTVLIQYCSLRITAGSVQSAICDYS